MKWFLQKFSQPSSWAGFGAIVQAVSGALYAGQPMSVAIPTALAGAVAILTDEKGPQNG